MKTYIIYEIRCLDTNITEVYIGSTTNFRVRKNAHKSICNNINDKSHNLHIYNLIRENNGWNSWCMRPLEQIECKTNMEARIREQYWIEKNEAKLNSNKAHITEEQIKEQQKIYNAKYVEQFEEQRKIYLDKNKEKIKEIKKKWYAKNIEQIKEQRKIYRDENKEQNKDYQKIYYAENKVKILIKVKQKYDCICGGNYAISYKSQHTKTKKHTDFIKEIEQIENA